MFRAKKLMLITRSTSALLGMMPKYIGIKPDYEKTVDQGYQDYTLKIVEFYDLSFLTNCDVRNVSAGMPTWVCNWAAESLSELLPGRRAAASSTCEIEYISAGLLTAVGVHSGTVLSVEQISHINFFSDVIRVIENHSSRYATCILPVGCGSMTEVYCRTLCGDEDQDLYVPRTKGRPDLQACITDLLLHLGSDEATSIPLSPAINSELYMDFVRLFCKGRSLIVTKEGYIGLASSATQRDDQVCVLLGCDVPLLLRPVGDGHQIIGACYMHGFMDGEVLLGSLPSNYRAIIQHKADLKMCSHAFLGCLTGEVTDVDPRTGLDLYEESARRSKEKGTTWREESRPLFKEIMQDRKVFLKTFELV